MANSRKEDERPKSLATETWVNISESIKAGRLKKIILPIGSLEQHGPHLPILTDAMIANYVANAVCKECASTILMPTLYVSCSGEHSGFPGTISMRVETMIGLLLDISNSLMKSDINSLVIINGYGGNRSVIDSAIINIKDAIPEFQIYSFTILDIVKQKFNEIRKSRRGHVGHADEIETSMMLAIAPELVNISQAVSEEPSLPSVLSFEPEDLARVSFGWRARTISKSGVIGDPLSATKESGMLLLSFAIETISKVLNGL